MNETDKEKLDEDFESWFNAVVNSRSSAPNIRAIAEWWLDKIDPLIERAVEEYKQGLRFYGYGDDVAFYEKVIAQHRASVGKFIALPQDGKEIK